MEELQKQEKELAELKAQKESEQKAEEEEVRKQALLKKTTSTSTSTSITSSTTLSNKSSPVNNQTLLQKYPSSRGTIAPVSNILAFQRAKEKIDQIKAAKLQTFAKTASKHTPRVAHISKAVIEVSFFFRFFNFIIKVFF